jgi:predicted HicB family RNase H-like nuclease
MSVMSYKGYKARVEFDAEDEIFVGHLAGINDVVGFHADTVIDLKAAFHEAVDHYQEACRKAGKSPEKPYSGQVMFRVAPEVHASAALAAQLAGKSLNQWGEEALRDAAERSLASQHAAEPQGNSGDR